MVRKHTANNVNADTFNADVPLDLTFLCDVRLKLRNSEQIHILSYCKNFMVRHDHYLSSALALYVDIHAYY